MMKNKEKGTENNSKKEEERIMNRKSRNCFGCDENPKQIQEADQNNHNLNNYKIETHYIKGLIIVEVH